jgi:hypothetical protein
MKIEGNSCMSDHKHNNWDAVGTAPFNLHSEERKETESKLK